MTTHHDIYTPWPGEGTWSLWDGETSMAFANRVDSGISEMLDNLGSAEPEPPAGYEAMVAAWRAIRVYDATDIAVRVEPDRVRIVYRTPHTTHQPH